MIIIIFGPPGSGKDTQARMLAERHGLYLVETSKVFEEKRAHNPNDPEIIQAQKDLTAGRLFDTHFAFRIIQEKILSLMAQSKNGFIFNGSPRTLIEVNLLVPFLKETFGKNSINVFYLKVSKEEALRRILLRKVCSFCKRPVNPELLAKNPSLAHCPSCKKPLEIRPDDNSTAIAVRFDQYTERTFPILNRLKELTVPINEINGEQSIEQVFAEINTHELR